MTIHNDGTYTVHPNQKGRGTGKMPALPPRQYNQPSPGARAAPNCAPGHKPKNNQQKERNVENRKEEKVTPFPAACSCGWLRWRWPLCWCWGLPPDSLPDSGHTVKPSTGSSQPFEMHFIDVGQALSVLVECDGQFMLYDGGNVDDGSLVVSYLQKQGVGSCNMCSAPMLTRTMGGFAAVMAKFPAGHAYSPVTESSTKCFNDFVKYTSSRAYSWKCLPWARSGRWAAPLLGPAGPVTGYSGTTTPRWCCASTIGATPVSC